MLLPDYLMNRLGAITALYADLHTEILKSITRFMAKNLNGGKLNTAIAAGLLREEIISHIANTTNTSKSEVRSLFETAALDALNYDNMIYNAAGLSALTQSETMKQIVSAGISKQHGSLQRLTGTIAVNSESLFNRTINTAYNKVVAGTHSYTEALRDGVRDLLNEGVTAFRYASGRNISIEAALLMNLRTGIYQTAGEITKQGMIERGVSYAEVSAHMGARNTGGGFKNHESWQGKVYFYSEIATEPNTHDLPDLTEITGLGDIAGLLGVNCRHSYAPFFPGISEPRWTQEELEKYAEKTYTFTGGDGKEHTVGAYKASQIQRSFERKIRDIKRKISVKKVTDEDVTNEKATLKAVRSRYKRFLADTGLRQQHFRERIE